MYPSSEPYGASVASHSCTVELSLGSYSFFPSYHNPITLGLNKVLNYEVSLRQVMMDDPSVISDLQKRYKK